MKLSFEWDEIKERANIKKHGVSFHEGKTIFHDPFLLTYPDSAHSEHEDRYINLGLSSVGRILLLVHTERKNNIRIISCRTATSREIHFYNSVRNQKTL